MYSFKGVTSCLIRQMSEFKYNQAFDLSLGPSHHRCQGKRRILSGRYKSPIVA